MTPVGVAQTTITTTRPRGAELWGKYLAEELPEIYAGQAAVVVVFVSAEYASGAWTRLERRAALGRAVTEAGVYVLPARFDDSELPGLLRTRTVLSPPAEASKVPSGLNTTPLMPPVKVPRPVWPVSS